MYKQTFKIVNFFKNSAECSDVFNRTSFRHLRGTRRSKDMNSEELKFQQFLRTLKGNSSKSNENNAGVANSDTSNLTQENAVLQESSISNKVVPSIITIEDHFLRLEEKITPLKELPYTRQLEKKFKKSLSFLRVFGCKLQYLKIPIVLGPDKLPCPLELTVPSPVTEAYRNKDEFSIGPGFDGNAKTVGFYLESMSGNSGQLCISPEKLMIIKESHKKFINDFQNYVRQSSLPAYVRFDDQGYWKSVIVRSTEEGDLMGTIVMHPQALNKEEIEVEKEKLQHYFSSAPEDKYRLRSLYFQTCCHSRCTHEQSPFQLLLGKPHVIEKLNDWDFHISPDSFFHTNTKAAECMYNSIKKLCRVKPSTTVLDIFCGTGPMSLLFSPEVKKCIGIDSCIQSISDAKINAKCNNRHNVEFFHSQPEFLLKTVLGADYHEDLIAIINPSRMKSARSIIPSLRECKYLKKLIYITISPKSEMDSLVQLCIPAGPHHYLGKPFLPILAFPVDLFPHTEHYGLIIMFQRL